MSNILYPPSTNGLQKTLSSALDQGVTASMSLNNTTGIPDSPGVVVIDRIDSNGDEKSAALREFIEYGGVSGSTLTGLVRGLANSSDQDHAINAVVEFIPDVTWGTRVAEALATVVSATAHTTVNTTNVVTPTGTQTLTNKTLTSPKVGTAITDTNGNEVIKTPATSSAVNELEVVNAATGNAVQVNTTGGDTNINLEINPKGTGVIKAKTTVELEVVASGSNTSTGDAKRFFRVPKELDGFNLVDVAAVVYTAGTTNTTDIQIRNKTQTADMLSTKLTIDSGETDSATAATAAVIDTSNDDVAWKDVIAIDIDAVSSTPAQGLVVALTFAKP